MPYANYANVGNLGKTPQNNNNRTEQNNKRFDSQMELKANHAHKTSMYTYHEVTSTLKWEGSSF